MGCAGVLKSVITHIVDDDDSFRRSAARLIRSWGWDARPFASAREFLESIDAKSSGCVLLDYQMPDMNGLIVQRHMADNSIDLPLVFLSGNADIPVSVTAIKHGAVDFLVKPVVEDELFNALRQAINKHNADADEKRIKEAITESFARLSPREKEVLYLVIQGRLNKQAAYELGIAEKTIKVHRARVMEKMKASSLAQLVQMCLSAGITSQFQGESSIAKMQ